MKSADELIDLYSKELEQDTDIDILDVLDKQRRLPNIRHKWQFRLMNAKRDLLKLEEAEKDFLNKVLSDCPVDLSKAKAAKKAENDSNYRVLQTSIKEYLILIEYLEVAVNKNLYQMGYDIKNLIDLMKFEQL